MYIACSLKHVHTPHITCYIGMLAPTVKIFLHYNVAVARTYSKYNTLDV